MVKKCPYITCPICYKRHLIDCSGFSCTDCDGGGEAVDDCKHNDHSVMVELIVQIEQLKEERNEALRQLSKANRLIESQKRWREQYKTINFGKAYGMTQSSLKGILTGRITGGKSGK